MRCCRFVLLIAALGVATQVTAAQSMSARTLPLDEKFRHAGEMKYCAGFFLMVVAKDRSLSSSPRKVANQTVYVLNQEGQEVFTCSPAADLREATDLSVHFVAMNRNGVLAVTGAAEGMAAFPVGVVMLYDLRTQRLKRIVRTDRIFVRAVAVDEQDNVWLLGPEMDERHRSLADGKLLHKLAPDGQLRDSYVPYNSFAPRHSGGKPVEPFGKRFRSYDPACLYADQEGKVYAWFAGHLSLHVLNTEGELVQTTKIAEPSFEGRFYNSLALQPGGKIVALLDIGVRRLRQGKGDWQVVSSDADLEARQLFARSNQKRTVVLGADDRFLMVYDGVNNSLVWISLATGQ